LCLLGCIAMLLADINGIPARMLTSKSFTTKASNSKSIPILESVKWKWEVPYCIWIAKSARVAKTIGHYRSIKSWSNDCRSNKCRSNERKYYFI
jgi:hypothetical protein